MKQRTSAKRQKLRWINFGRGETPKGISINKRITGIDGWRAIAAIGVLYTHTWATLQFPHFSVAGIDLMQVLNLWGSGVHLFFVISGLCFYLVMHRLSSIDTKSTSRFLKKRWLRIAPAFYTACLIYVAVQALPGTGTNNNTAHLGKLLANFCFLQTYIPGTEINGIFWSLAVEWHFYLLLPLLFWGIKIKGFRFTIGFTAAIGFVISFLHYAGTIMDGFEWWYTIFLNINHFVWGIILGRIYQEKKYPGLGSLSKYGFFIGLAVAYAGKLMFSAAFVTKLGPADFLFQSAGPMVMTFGFALLLFSTLTNKRLFGIMSSKALVFVGKISYSFYLWHALVLSFVFNLTKHLIPRTAAGVLLLMFIILLFLIPISYLSYQLLELPYFKKRKREEISGHHYAPNPV